jgi:hypothetical protein
MGRVYISCHVEIDDFSACLLFARPNKDKSNEIKLDQENFNENGSNQIQRCSSEERRCYTSFYRRQRYVDNLKIEKGIKEIETGLSSVKTLEELNHLFEFYEFKFALFRLHDYQVH